MPRRGLRATVGRWPRSWRSPWAATPWRKGSPRSPEDAGGAVLGSRRGSRLQSPVREAVGERLRLLLESGPQIRGRHFQPQDAPLWLAVLHFSEPREHRLDLAARRHEVRLVGESPAGPLGELSLLPEV